MPPSNNSEQRASAAGLTKELDALPPPRRLGPSSVTAELVGELMLLATPQVNGNPFTMAHVAMETDTPGEWHAVVTRALREAGQRVGPFRNRKIRHLMTLGFSDD